MIHDIMGFRSADMVRIKICGITTRDDALVAIEAGAHALGFVFAPSPRRVTPEAVEDIVGVIPPFIARVGVFVDEKASEIRRIMKRCRLDVAQFHGSESPLEVGRFYPNSIKAIRMQTRESVEALSSYRVGAFLLDAYDPAVKGGTGRAFNWEWAPAAKACGVPLILSGGLTPDNVLEALRVVRPYAIDVSSGVEKKPGSKDPEKVRALIERVRDFR
jgi:phosphoribosylanthranilate isomerase